MTSPEYKFGTWYPIAESPEGVPVNTRINDLDGIRNEQVMTRSGRLWWIKDMYVYYQPTEWTPLPPPPGAELTISNEAGSEGGENA